MASGFAITPDLQQIKQFEATSGRGVTQQAIQGITQQAIQTAASRSEQRRALDLQQQNISSQADARQQQLSLQTDKFNAFTKQQDIQNKFQQTEFAAQQKQQEQNNTFRDTAFQAQQQQNAIQNKFNETAFQAQQKNMAKRFGLDQQELDFKMKNQTELIGLDRERIKLEARRTGIAEQQLVNEREAQDFNRRLDTKKFDLTVKGFNLNTQAFQDTRKDNRDALRIKNILIADERRATQRQRIPDSVTGSFNRFTPRSIVNNAIARELAAFDARPDKSFLPSGTLL